MNKSILQRPWRVLRFWWFESRDCQCGISPGKKWDNTKKINKYVGYFGEEGSS